LYTFINSNIIKSKVQKICPEKIIAKYEEVTPNKDFDYIFYELNEMEIPIGKCHGDLTLSNILYNGKFIIIDFLDSFIETPIMDIVKIKQDTKYGWSFMIAEQSINTRMKCIMKEINNNLDNRFKHFEWFKYCKIFEILCLMKYCMS